MGWFKKYQRLVEVDEDEEEKEKGRADAQASSFDFEISFSRPKNGWINSLRCNEYIITY